MQSGVSVSMSGVIEGTDHFECGQRAQYAVELAAGRLGVEVRAEPDRRLRHVAAFAQPEHRSQGVDTDLEARGLASSAEPVADLLVLGAQRQPPPPRPWRWRRISLFS